MRRICFLSMDSLDGYVADDELAVEPLARLGFRVDTLSWRDPAVDWNNYEAVIIRTPWDYQRSPAEFLNVLETIDSSSARLENSLDIVRWNLDKRYLIDMEQRGCRIVPTIWDASYSEVEFESWLEQFDVDELIIKPTVSATAEHTYRLKTYDSALESVYANRSFMVQPFMPNIVAEGEYSLFFFSGEYSHTINKSPKTADFRVQEEHGGIITEVEPDDKLRDAAQNALDKIGEPLLYARVDLVRDDEDEFALMELELIEPALYLRMSDGAPERFAAAIETLLK
ncbi:MAG: hypothetical protein IPK98_09840 [Chloracidobacterium sp.]|nr:hypothetical protein [Chloracidobacterium sp.]